MFSRFKKPDGPAKPGSPMPPGGGQTGAQTGGAASGGPKPSPSPMSQSRAPARNPAEVAQADKDLKRKERLQ